MNNIVNTNHLRAAIYARYSSDNQRVESIEDQISACRKFAANNNIEVMEGHIYCDAAKSGARWDRKELAAMKQAAEDGDFNVLLVDDLSRLARDNYLFLTILAELEYLDIRLISVADGIDTSDEQATLAVQMRGIFNELMLRDLRAKTLRGQLGQKARGFFVGEHTYGFKSIAAGETRMGKNGPRPEGYKMQIDPREAAIVLRIFEEYAAGRSLNLIAATLNEENVVGRQKSKKGWVPSMISRILRREKYIGRWTWNKNEAKKDPKSKRRRPKLKPESEWIVTVDEALRIVPQELWDRVQEMAAKRTKSFPKKERVRNRGCFSKGHGSREEYLPTHLFGGSLMCGTCGAAIQLVGGKGGGYYGCGAAIRGACTNKVKVPRSRLERNVLDAVSGVISQPENVAAVLRKVATELEKQSGDAPEKIHLKEVELEAEERRLANMIEFVAEGRGTPALAKAMEATEQRVARLGGEVASMRERHARVFQVPPPAWIEDRLANLREVLSQKTGPSALALRNLLGRIRLDPQQPDIGREYYVAHTTVGVLDLLEEGHRQRLAEAQAALSSVLAAKSKNSGLPPAAAPLQLPANAVSDESSDVLPKWRRRESNPGPEAVSKDVYVCIRWI